MPFIKKVLAFVIAIIAGIVLATLLMLPIVYAGGSSPAPFYGLFSATMAILLGRWVYRRLCILFLKKKDVEQVIESQAMDLGEINDKKSEIETKYESQNLK